MPSGVPVPNEIHMQLTQRTGSASPAKAMAIAASAVGAFGQQPREADSRWLLEIATRIRRTAAAAAYLHGALMAKESEASE